MPQTPLTKSYVQVPRRTAFSGKTIGQSFNDMANSRPDDEMYVFYTDKERKTCRQIQQESQQYAGGLLSLGLKKGDNLFVWGGNHYEWVLTTLAAYQIGLVVNHMQIDFPIEFEKKVLIKAEVNVIVSMRSPSDLYDKVCKIVPELLTNPADKLECKSIPTLKYVINAGSKTTSGAFSISQIMEMGKKVDAATVMEAIEKVDMDDRAAVYFTSGSTGFPKSVPHTHKSLYLYEFTGQLQNFADHARDNKCPWPPKFAQVTSFGGISAQDGILYPIYVPGTTVIVAPAYDLEMLVKAVPEERVTGSIFLIHHLSDLVNYPNIDDYDFSSFEMSIFGGSVLPRSLLDKARKLFKHVLQSYAATEGFAATQTPRDSMEIQEAPAYPAIEGSEVKVVGDDGLIVPINSVGEICFRGEMMFARYLGDEEKTKAALSETGWYRSGDLGTMDENGYIRIVGRKAEFIIKGGRNLAPGNLEKILDQHPAINNVMVVGVPDERESEEICIYARLHPSAKLTAEELREFCRGKEIDSYEPKYVVFVEEEFPANEIGKFDRKKITEQARIILGLPKPEE